VAGVSAVAKRKKQRTWEPDEQVSVPDADEMDDDQFLRHLDKRHTHETSVEGALHKSAHIQQAWVGTYRAFHEYQHRVNGDDTYDHVHEWDDDDDY
jgi:hypothetical protein